MKKKLFSLLTALVLCLLCAVPAFAEMPLVMDTYELFMVTLRSVLLTW